jgi:hypothetical protein
VERPEALRGGDEHGKARPAWLAGRAFLLAWAGLLVPLAALLLVSRPMALRLVDFALGAPGANLAVDALLAQGLRTTMDFGYPYELLSLAVARGGFWGIGRLGPC